MKRMMLVGVIMALASGCDEEPCEPREVPGDVAGPECASELHAQSACALLERGVLADAREWAFENTGETCEPSCPWLWPNPGRETVAGDVFVECYRTIRADVQRGTVTCADIDTAIAACVAIPHPTTCGACE